MGYDHVEWRMSILSKPELLLNIVEMRAALLRVGSEGRIDERVEHLCEALACWTKLPSQARQFYRQITLDAVFELSADIEDCPLMDEVHRWVVELSLWQAVCELELDRGDQRAHYVTNRRNRLEQRLVPTCANSAIYLMYLWTSLLAPRHQKVLHLPGPFSTDISRMIDALADAGLPRRARALALKFQFSVQPLIKWNIEHRPEGEEISRTIGLLEKISIPSQPVPYRVFVCTRALHKVLSAPVTSIPLSVSTNGYIHIGDSVYGGLAAPEPVSTQAGRVRTMRFANTKTDRRF
jgi:hypothetical protein